MKFKFPRVSFFCCCQTENSDDPYEDVRVVIDKKRSPKEPLLKDNGRPATRPPEPTP